jgi:hypothetical protein
MFLTTHALAGGLLAEKIDNPLIVYPLILVTHFFMDSLPHWDFGSYAGKEIQKRGQIKSLTKRFKLGLLGAVDLSMVCLGSWLFFRNKLLTNPSVSIGILVGLLPDLLEVPPLFLNWRPFPLNKLEEFHSRRIHHSAKLIFGIIPQIIILILVFWLR